jgi:hypothetical protein
MQIGPGMMELGCRLILKTGASPSPTWIIFISAHEYAHTAHIDFLPARDKWPRNRTSDEPK